MIDLKSKNGFMDSLELQWVGGKRPYLLTAEFRFASEVAGGMIRVPKGYKTDFASIPWFFWRILPKNGPYTPATVIHDWLCDLRGGTGIDSYTTHKIFLEAMQALGVPWWKRTVMYRAVALFGPRFKT